MESVIDNIKKVLGEEDSPDVEEITPNHERAVLNSSQQMMQKVETIEKKKKQDAAVKKLDSKKQSQMLHTAPRLMDGRECDSFIDHEMDLRQKKTRWHNMDACFRWKKIQEYVYDSAIDDKAVVLQDLKKMLRSHNLDKVLYDIAAQKITKLNYLDI
jgi:hypothetical protein